MAVDFHIHTCICGSTAAGRVKVMWPSKMLLPTILIKICSLNVDLTEKKTAGGEITRALVPATCATRFPNYPNDSNYKGIFKFMFSK